MAQIKIIKGDLNKSKKYYWSKVWEIGGKRDSPKI